MRIDACLSSKNMEWETPQDFFDGLNKRFHFSIDVCENDKNAKCPVYYTPEQDGLKQPWAGNCWMNPHYGREIGKWIKKAYEESRKWATVVCLIPSRTDTAYWHDYVMKSDKVEFVRERLKFGGATENAPFPNAVVIFAGRNSHDLQSSKL